MSAINQSEELLLQSLSAFFHGTTVTPPSDVDVLEHTFDLARIHFVLPMVYEALGSAVEPSGPAAAAKRISVNAVVNQALKTRSFLEIYSSFNDEGVKALVIKGLICRSIYPKPDHRASNDEDIFIMPQDFSQARKILSGRGFVQSGSITSPNQTECAYYKPPGFIVELHQRLFDDSSESFENMNNIFSGAFDNAIQIEIQGVKVWTMNYTDHMLYLITHSLKHFVHSGVGIRQICDINIYADTYSDKINWEYVFPILKQLRADIFAINAFEIGKKYLGYDIRCLRPYFEQYAVDVDCGDLIEDILSAGIYGSSSTGRRHSSTITLNSFNSNGKVNIMRSLFPRAENIMGKYTYLQKHPFLLPIAWLQRIAGYAASGRFKSARDSVDIGCVRTELMKKYRIID